MATTESSAAPLLAGVARVEVTPPLGTWLAGYARPDRFAERVDDPLYATSLALEQRGQRAALLVLDWVIIEEEERFAIASAVEERTGIPASNIIIHAIQTHSAPQTQTVFGFNAKDSAYIASALPRIVDCVCSAWSGRERVRIGVGIGRCDAGVNRRQIREDGEVVLGVNPFGPYDPEVTLLRFDAHDRHLATVVNYGAHPTTRGGESLAVSRDWPGVAVDFLAAHTGGTVMFLNGVVGDVAPRCTRPGPQGSLEVGMVVGREAARVFDTIQCRDEAGMQVFAEEIGFPLAPLEPREVAKARLATLPEKPKDWFEEGSRRHYEAVLREWDSGEIKTQRPFLQALLQIGDAAIVPFPGELFAEIGLRLKHASPFPRTLIASTSNGSLGYLVTREARARGGFEVMVAQTIYGAYALDDNIDDFLVAKILELLRRLRERPQ